MKLDLQDQNELQRRLKQCESGKRDSKLDLQKANDSAHALGRKFRDSATKGSNFSTAAAENYARALHEATICELVLTFFEKSKEEVA